MESRRLAQSHNEHVMPQCGLLVDGTACESRIFDLLVEREGYRTWLQEVNLLIEVVDINERNECLMLQVRFTDLKTSR